jgi:hypothetical protein
MGDDRGPLDRVKDAVAAGVPVPDGGAVRHRPVRQVGRAAVRGRGRPGRARRRPHTRRAPGVRDPRALPLVGRAGRRRLPALPPRAHRSGTGALIHP